MTRSYPKVLIFDELKMVIGERDEETNSYHIHAPEHEVSYWYEAITACLGPIVTPAFASKIVGVSRPTVHNNIKSGGLTSFHFHPSVDEKAGGGESREAPYVFVTMRECRAWSKFIFERELRRQSITADQVNENKPDWYFEFYDWLHSGSLEGIQDEIDEEQREHFERYKEFCHFKYNG